jgi:hypothetical protein
MLPKTVSRIYHLTFYKAGSQWVRDVLLDPRIQAVTGFSASVSGIDIPSSAWPEVPRHTIASPLYCATRNDWRDNSKTTDRALIVIRDPRDIAISLVFSLGLSHVPSSLTSMLRTPIQNATKRDRILLGVFLLAQWSERLRTWGLRRPISRECHVGYEQLIADQHGQFARIFDFFGWNIPAATLEAVVSDHSFAVTSGRAPGQENEFSHRRKGIAGDWKNYFDRDLGRVFEECLPGLLQNLKYEKQSTWWQELPDVAPGLSDTTEAVDSERARLLNVLAEHAGQLDIIRGHAEQRLADVQTLTAMVHAERQLKEEQQALAEESVLEIQRLRRRIAILEKGIASDGSHGQSNVDRLLRRVNELRLELGLNEDLKRQATARELSGTSRLHSPQHRR